MAAQFKEMYYHPQDKGLLICTTSFVLRKNYIPKQSFLTLNTPYINKYNILILKKYDGYLIFF